MQNDLDPKGLANLIMLEMQFKDFGRLDPETGDFTHTSAQFDLLEQACAKAAERVIGHLSAAVPAGDGELVERLTAEADYLDANLKTFTGPLSTITALRDAASRLSQGTGVRDAQVLRLAEENEALTQNAESLLEIIDMRKARIKALEEALAYSVRGLDMIHNGLMDPTRPRQAVGEVCAHFLDQARAALKENAL